MRTKSENILTEYQSLTFAVFDPNPNVYLIRWKVVIDENNTKLIYKQGKENVVGDTKHKFLRFYKGNAKLDNEESLTPTYTLLMLYTAFHAMLAFIQHNLTELLHT